MKSLIIVLFTLASIPLLSQNVDSVGYLSILTGNGLCIRKGTETSLKIPFYFLNGDQIKIKNGSALVVLYSEEEVKIKSGESITLSHTKPVKPKNSELLMYMNTKQSNPSYKIRGIADPKFKIFPLKSKILDPTNVFIHVHSLADKNKKYFFKLMRYQNNEVVYQLSEVNSDSIALQLAPFEKACKYIWKIKFPEYEVVGEITTFSDEQIKQIPKFTFNNRASYMEAYNYYYKELLIFEAYEIIEKALQAYPDDMYFGYIKNNMFW